MEMLLIARSPAATCLRIAEVRRRNLEECRAAVSGLNVAAAAEVMARGASRLTELMSSLWRVSELPFALVHSWGDMAPRGVIDGKDGARTVGLAGT